ncbi:hypothetical protein ACIQMV_19270 [Streptomyces sp. NPDC091412]|uniref:hypothetical protein n=1 Tax=Streptomyces sp. NPDC091412 TaxID=3366002 RepID=UPI00380441E8
MTETPQTPPHRQPGVRYKRDKVQRPVTTVIDGKPSTRMVTEEVWVALPPRDWDEIIRRGAVAVAIVVTLLAAAGTVASVGGLLSRMLHPGVSYATGAVFTASWLVCLGIEHIERVDAARAARARGAGWAMLVVGMGAVITYGAVLHQLPAGIIGSFLDAAAKGLWWLIMGLDRVKLDPDVAHWVADQEQRMAGRYLLGVRLGRLNRRAAQLHGGGSEFQAAEAILASAAQPQQLPATDTSGHDREVSESVSGQADASSAPTPPAAPVPPPATPTPPAQPAPPADAGATGSSQQQGAQGKALRPVGPPSIAQTIRDVLSTDPKISDADLIDRVKAVHGDGGDPVKFAATVTRTRHRIEKPRPKRTA